MSAFGIQNSVLTIPSLAPKAFSAQQMLLISHPTITAANRLGIITPFGFKSGSHVIVSSAQGNDSQTQIFVLLPYTRTNSFSATAKADSASASDQKDTASQKPILPLPRLKPILPQHQIKKTLPLLRQKPILPQPRLKPILPQHQIKKTLPLPRLKPILPQHQIKKTLPLLRLKPILPQHQIKKTLPLPRLKPILPLLRLRLITPLQIPRQNQKKGNLKKTRIRLLRMPCRPGVVVKKPKLLRPI